MGLLDNLGKDLGRQVGAAIKQPANAIGSTANNAAATPVPPGGQAITPDGANGTKAIVFQQLPTTLAEFMALPQATLQSPYDSVAMFVVALSQYTVNRDESIAMINYLRGPQPMSQLDLQRLKEQASSYPYVTRSYFTGAVPQNDYTPSVPYKVVLGTNPYSFTTPNTAKLFVHCGGADSDRPCSTRLAKDAKWYVIEYSSLMMGIRKPESQNPWA